MKVIKFKEVDLSLLFSFILAYDSPPGQIIVTFIDNTLKSNSANFQLFLIKFPLKSIYLIRK